MKVDFSSMKFNAFQLDVSFFDKFAITSFYEGKF